MGVPLNHPFLFGMFPYKPSSNYWGTPMTMETSISIHFYTHHLAIILYNHIIQYYTPLITIIRLHPSYTHHIPIIYPPIIYPSYTHHIPIMYPSYTHQPQFLRTCLFFLVPSISRPFFASIFCLLASSSARNLGTPPLFLKRNNWGIYRETKHVGKVTFFFLVIHEHEG